MRLIDTGIDELNEAIDGLFFSIGTQLIRPKKTNFFSNWKMEHELCDDIE